MMTKEQVVELCIDKSAEEIAREHSTSELTEMYVCLFGIAPQGRKTKTDLAYWIRYFIEDMKRTQDLFKNLR